MNALTLSLCTIRPFRRGDEDALAAVANDREVWRNLRDIFPHPYTRADAELWIGFNVDQPASLNFAIEVDGVLAGGIGLTPGVDVHKHSAEIGYWLGRAYWGRGIATQATRALSDWALAQPGYRRLFAAVFAWNPASARVLERAGYVLEGRMRNYAFKDGQFVDGLLYARTR